MPSLAAAFDERCARLNARVAHSIEELSALHERRVERDVQGVKALAVDCGTLRTNIEALDSELQPRLQRLAAAEPQHALPPKFTHASVRLEPTTQQLKAITDLQQAWRQSRAVSSSGSAQHALAQCRYCPEALRRNFVLGIRTPLDETHAPSPAIMATLPPPPPPPPSAQQLAAPTDIAAAQMVPAGPTHFMSIL